MHAINRLLEAESGIKCKNMCFSYHFGRGWICCYQPRPPKCHFRCLWSTFSGRGWSQINQPRPWSHLPVLSVYVLCRFAHSEYPALDWSQYSLPPIHLERSERGFSVLAVRISAQKAISLRRESTKCSLCAFWEDWRLKQFGPGQEAEAFGRQGGV